jgi:predicted neuraminidase
LRLFWGAAFSVVLLGIDLAGRARLPEAAKAVWPDDHLDVSVPVTFEIRDGGRIPMPADTAAAHASTLLALPDGHPSAMLAFWFAGSRESGPDVKIVASHFGRDTRQWSQPQIVVNRQQLGPTLGFGVRRLGNPVAWRDAQGRIHLFVVATGMGGWAAARILHLRQIDDGHDFSKLEFRPTRVLPLSWLWNTSHLVRTMPMPLADGGMLLPVYFELGLKYPMALRFDAAGEFRGMERISRRGQLLQPTLLMRSEAHWLALMRDGGADKKIKVAQTFNGGRDWQDSAALLLPNPDAAIAGLGLRPGLMVLAHNAAPDSRGALDLSSSPDGLQWTRQLSLAKGDVASEYSYPSLAWADGSLWVSYTDQRRAIAWQRLALAPSAR